MAQVNVTINEQVFRVGCEEGQEQMLLDLADDLNHRIETFRSSFGEVGRMRLMIMAALEIGDELQEARRRISALESELGNLRDAEASVETRIAAAQESMAETLDSAAQRVEGLTAALNGRSD